MSKPYQPCEVDGKPCDWVYEEWEDLDGVIVEDWYCDKCFRMREWDEEAMSEATKACIEGDGVAIYGNESDEYLDLDDCEPMGIAELFEKVGGESAPESICHLFRYADLHEERLQAYRAETGRQFPKAYRVKISVELEELPDDETEAFWKRRQRKKENTGAGE